MTVLDRAERFFRRGLWAMDVGPLPWFQRAAIQTLRMFIAVGAEFRHRLFDARAAGLVYTTLLAMVPFLAVSFSLLKAFGVHELIEPVLAEALYPLGTKGQELTEAIIGFVNDLNVGVLGAVGVAALFLTAYSLISKIEDALNAVWRVRQGRVWTRRFTDYLSVVLVGPLLLVIATGLMGSMKSTHLVQWVLKSDAFGPAAVWVAKLTPFLILLGGFTFLHKFVPNTRVALRSAAVGGLTTAVLWLIGGQAFASFVVTSARYSALYSSFAILILFLIWLYVSWLVVLVGAQVAFFHQHPAAYQLHLPWQSASHAARERLGLTLLLRITRRHLAGKPPLTVRNLTSQSEAPSSVVEELLNDFVSGELLGRFEEPPGIALVRAPETIPMTEVLEVMDRRSAVLESDDETDDAPDPVKAFVRQRDRAVARELEGATLRSFAEGGSDPTR